jgi:hypothetical protein
LRQPEERMIRRLFITGAVVVSLATAATAQDQLASFAEALRIRAAEIKQAPAILRWQEIPWVTDLNEGLRLAREENRPLLLWTTGDEPLGRC